MSGRPIVYIVDDDESVRDSLQTFLRSYGFDAQPFASAQAFLSGYDPTHSGCVILDVSMPRMSGIELQDRLIEEGRSLPIVFITGRLDVPSVSLLARGAFAVLYKPIQDDELLAAVIATLGEDKRLPYPKL